MSAINQNGTIRLGIVEGFRLIKIGLTRFFQGGQTFEVVGVTENGEQGLEMTSSQRPDVLLVNVDLDGMDGIEFTAQVRHMQLDIKIVILCTSPEEKRIVAAMQAGADAYCLKNNNPEHLAEVVQSVVKGGAWLDPPVARKMFALLANGKLASVSALIEETDGTHVDYGLNEREQQILGLIVEGRNNAEIAEALYVSYHTIKSDVTQILKKLGVHDRVQAAVKALKEKLV